jgi:hypothetical protein
MTDKEAKKKICPLSRLDCLGSHCGVWVWTRHGTIQGLHPTDGVIKIELPKDQWQGKCGLMK